MKDEGRVIESFPPESGPQEDSLWRALLVPQDLALSGKGGSGEWERVTIGV